MCLCLVMGFVLQYCKWKHVELCTHTERFSFNRMYHVKFGFGIYKGLFCNILQLNVKIFFKTRVRITQERIQGIAILFVV